MSSATTPAATPATKQVECFQTRTNQWIEARFGGSERVRSILNYTTATKEDNVVMKVVKAVGWIFASLLTGIVGCLYSGASYAYNFVANCCSTKSTKKVSESLGNAKEEIGNAGANVPNAAAEVINKTSAAGDAVANDVSQAPQDALNAVKDPTTESSENKE